MNEDESSSSIYKEYIIVNKVVNKGKNDDNNELNRKERKGKRDYIKKIEKEEKSIKVEVGIHHLNHRMIVVVAINHANRKEGNCIRERIVERKNVMKSG